MKPFVIELYWPDMTPALVDKLVARAAQAARGANGTVSYVGCTLAPRDETCFLRVAADDEGAVRALVERLGVEGARVSELVEVPSPSDPLDDPASSTSVRFNTSAHRPSK